MIADQNHDGVLSQRELAEFSDFQHADLNHDGRVDPFEMNLFMRQNQIGNRKYTNFQIFFSHISFVLYRSTTSSSVLPSSSSSSSTCASNISLLSNYYIICCTMLFSFSVYKIFYSRKSNKIFNNLIMIV